MRIHSVSVIRHPRARVYAAYRDELAAIAAYMPDIERIEIVDRKDDGPTVELHNVWVANREVPAFARKYVKPEMMRWDDYATWNGREHSCSWTLKTRMFTEAVTCGGRNTFEDLGDGTTRFTLTGDLTMDLRHIPGVPRLLASRLAPQVEKFVVALITPNLEKTNVALTRFLDAAGS